ncbi:MAG TPA: hypothetical protein RMH85_13600, partial [Polyangiaceae bacterium LLY-WYZ-15_(1-7)]|nr:hypothetical protein [Polyangiaceae bacterium LLY-WYZ-15_(1-7)]
PDAPPAPKAPPAAPTYPLEGALGISRVRLVRATPCGLTGRELGAGEEALLVHFDDGRPPLAVAPDALPTPPGDGTPPTGAPPEGDPA